jgi:putative sugar O-methyltransferase
VPEDRIVNNPRALNEMMADLDDYDGPLGPGPYWAENQRATLNWLNTNDLNTFRTFEPSGKALANFGGGCWWPSISEVRTQQSNLTTSLLYRLFQKLHFKPGIDHCGRAIKRGAFDLRLRTAFVMYLEALCRARDTDGELGKIEAALVGSPSDALEMNDRPYTPNFLVSFLRYLDMKKQINFADVDSYVEVGPGAGLFVEALAKVKPGLKIHLIDIPPQLYVLQQVLQGIFGDQVATYQQIKNDPSILKRDDHRIFILAPWQIDLIDRDSIGLAHNSGFGEMRKDTVEGYLSYFTKWRVKYIYICALDTKKTPLSIMTDDYDGLLPGHTLLSRVATHGPDALGPLDTTGKKIYVRPASDICFGLTGDSQ